MAGIDLPGQNANQSASQDLQYLQMDKQMVSGATCLLVRHVGNEIRTRSERCLQLLGKDTHLHEALVTEARHDHGMVRPWVW
jgi:hypothetical protein